MTDYEFMLLWVKTKLNLEERTQFGPPSYDEYKIDYKWGVRSVTIGSGDIMYPCIGTFYFTSDGDLTHHYLLD